MEDLKVLFTYLVSFYKIQFTIYGYTFSLWTILVYVVIGGFVIYMLGHAVRSIFYVQCWFIFLD